MADPDLVPTGSPVDADRSGPEVELAQQHGALDDELADEIDRLRPTSSRTSFSDEDIVSAVGQQLARAISSAHAAARDLTAGARAEAHRLVAEATAEAEIVGAELRARAAATNAEADARLAQIVADADGLVAAARAEADDSLAQARREAEAIVTAARRAATAEAEEISASARVEAESVRRQAAEERELVVSDAEATRERILGDLSRRRRAATVQIEQLRAGRERLLDTYGVVRRTLEEVHDDLERADGEARAAAQETGRRLAPGPGPHPSAGLVSENGRRRGAGAPGTGVAADVR